ncbi:MAG: LysR substrate-binding domain-containing protein [Rhodoglobus sp.]
MEIHQLNSFLAVAEELHFGRAAQRLHIAQPPLSRTIRQLEKDLGATLFDRNTRSVRLTSAGEALLGPAREVLNSCRLAELAVASAGRGLTGRIRIGFAGASSHLYVGRWVKLVREHHPGVEFELHSSAYARESLNKILDKTLDVGMVRWMSPTPGVASRVIAREQLVLALPNDHPLATQESIRIEDLADDAWVTLPAEPGSVLRDALIKVADDAGFYPRIVQSAPDSWSVMALVAAEVGCSLTLASVEASMANPGVVFRPLRDSPPPLDLRLVWRRGDDNPLLKEILRVSELALLEPGQEPS